MTEAAIREAARPNREVADHIPMVQGERTGALVPENAGQAMELAKMIAISSVGVPKHLRGQPAICLRVVMDSMQFGLNPFHLAGESFVINDQLQYSAKAIHSMVMQSGVIDGRLDVNYEGDTASLTCIVTGKARGSDTIHAKQARMSDITTKNSPLWKTDPHQQLGYYTIRAWCRLYAPDALMGLIAREDPQLANMGEAQVINGDGPRESDLDRVNRQLGVQTVDADYQEVDSEEPGDGEAEKKEPVDSTSPEVVDQTDPAGEDSDAYIVDRLCRSIGEATTPQQVDQILTRNINAYAELGRPSRALVDNRKRDKMKELGVK